MERAAWIEYKGKKILNGDYSNLKTGDVVGVMENVNRMVLSSGEEVLVLWDFTGTEFDNDIIRHLKNFESRQAAAKMKKTAVIGLEGANRKILSFYNSFTENNSRAYSLKEDALDWLSE